MLLGLPGIDEQPAEMRGKDNVFFLQIFHRCLYYEDLSLTCFFPSHSYSFFLFILLISPYSFFFFSLISTYWFLFSLIHSYFPLFILISNYSFFLFSHLISPHILIYFLCWTVSFLMSLTRFSFLHPPLNFSPHPPSQLPLLSPHSFK